LRCSPSFPYNNHGLRRRVPEVEFRGMICCILLCFPIMPHDNLDGRPAKMFQIDNTKSFLQPSLPLLKNEQQCYCHSSPECDLLVMAKVAIEWCVEKRICCSMQSPRPTAREKGMMGPVVVLSFISSSSTPHKKEIFIHCFFRNWTMCGKISF
jgi:hypothetical protein